MLIKKIEDYKLSDFDSATSQNVMEVLLKRYPDLKNDPTFLASFQQEKVVKSQPKTPHMAYQPKKDFGARQSDIEKAQAKTRYDVLNDILVRNHPNGGIKYFISPTEIDLKLIADKFNISENRLMKYNEINDSIIRKNQIIFLEQKNNSAAVPNYTVEVGETVYDIAQKLGVKTQKIYQKNNLYPGQTPAPGTVLQLP